MTERDTSNVPISTTTAAGSTTWVAMDCSWTTFPVTLAGLWVDFVMENSSMVPENQKQYIKQHPWTFATTYNWSMSDLFYKGP